MRMMPFCRHLEQQNLHHAAPSHAARMEHSTMRITARLLAPALMVLAVSSAGRAVAQPYGYAPVPALRFEPPPPPPPPGPRMIWQSGAWEWAGTGYVWRPGHYIGWRPSYRHWVPGHWS